jgi:hypothetical protein
MTATSSQQMGDMLKTGLPGVEVTDKVMADARDVIEGMIAEGAGALIVNHIMPKGLGVEMKFEVEE